MFPTQLDQRVYLNGDRQCHGGTVAELRHGGDTVIVRWDGGSRSAHAAVHLTAFEARLPQQRAS